MSPAFKFGSYTNIASSYSDNCWQTIADHPTPGAKACQGLALACSRMNTHDCLQSQIWHLHVAFIGKCRQLLHGGHMSQHGHLQGYWHERVMLTTMP